MNIPTIQPTTCPSESELANPANRWAIVFSHGGRGFIGRLVDGEDSGVVRLADPFDYASARKVTRGENGEPRIGMDRQVLPAEHFDVDELLVHADVVIVFASLSPKALEMMRGFLVPAWEGRAYMRKMGGRIQIASSIEAPR